MKKTIIIPSAAPVASMNEIAKLSQADRFKRFAERATASARAFIEMGKLHHAITGSLKKNQTIYGELRKLGVKDSTISNASYASRVWGELIAAGHLTEVQFDGFTFQDCLAICRVMGSQSKKRLDPEEIAVLVSEVPETFDDELRSVYETGMTVGEVEAQAKAQADAEAAQKAAEDKAEADRIALAEQQAREQEAEPAPVAESANPPVSEPAPESHPMTGVETPVAPVAPQNPAPSANIIPLPQATAESDPDAALPELLSVVDELLNAVLAMSHDARRTVFEKINECQGALADSLNAEAEIAA